MFIQNAGMLTDWNLFVSVIAAIFAGLAWWQVKRQADATADSAREAKRSADAAEQSAKIAAQMKDIALKEQDLSSGRWDAAYKPRLMVTFSDHHYNEIKQKHEYRKREYGAPVLLQVKNIGKLSCRLSSCTLDGKAIKGKLIKSSKTKDRMDGTLEGARLSPGEWQEFYVEAIPSIVPTLDQLRKLPPPRNEGYDIILKLVCLYEPNRSETWEIAVFIEDPKADVENPTWVNLVPRDSTVPTI